MGHPSHRATMRGVHVLLVLVGVAASRGSPLPSPLAGWTPDSPVNADELGPYEGGDMVGPVPPILKNGMVDEKYHWPNGVVPYKITGHFSDDELATIQRAMDAYYDLTGGCIVWKEHTDEHDYVKISSDDGGCHSSVGRHSGSQGLNLENP